MNKLSYTILFGLTFLYCFVLILVELEKDIRKQALIAKYFKLSNLSEKMPLPYISAATLWKLKSSEISALILALQLNVEKSMDMMATAYTKIFELKGGTIDGGTYRNFICLNKPVEIANEFGSYVIFGVGVYDADNDYGIFFWVRTINGPQKWISKEEYDIDNLLWLDESWGEYVYPNYIDFHSKCSGRKDYQDFYAQWPLLLESIETNGFTLDVVPEYMA